MELYVYETPDGTIADFRPYLDGFDHAYDDHRPLQAGDGRWEKVHNLCHPTYDYALEGKLRFVGRAEVQWRELMVFPLAWEQSFEPVDWEAPAAST